MKKIKFPTAHSVLLIIAALVALMTWIIPSGKYEQLAFDKEKKVFTHNFHEGSKEYPGTQATLDEFGIKTSLDKFTNGDIWKPVGIPGTYHELESNPQGIFEFIQSPLKGIMGAMDVILFVLIIGGFIGVIHKTGAFDAGIAKLAIILKGRERLLIVFITTLIAIGGTTFGLAEETIAFYPILVPVFLAAGYDAMVALAAIYIGSCVGTMCSTVNPFSAIIASNAAGIDWTNGLYGRLTMLVLGTAFCIWYIMKYAEKVRKDPTQSLIYDQKEEIEALFLKKKKKKEDLSVENITFGGSEKILDEHRVNESEPSSRYPLILIIFVLCFVVMIAGVSSWEWWFLEMTTIFFVGSIIIGLVAWMKETDFVDAFVKGANDLLSVALIIGLARGVTVLMDDGLISDTLLYYSSNTVDGMPKGVFVNVMMFLYAGLSFFIPSSSGMAVLSMPIMAPLGDVVDVGREHVVNAYQYGMGLMAFITPTGLILASLTMVNVTYDKWLKFVMPLLGWLTLITMFFLTVNVYLN